MKLCLCGLGRAGKEFVRYISKSTQHELVAVLCRDESPSFGSRVCDLTDVAIDSSLCVQRISEFDCNRKNFDVIIDFSACETSLKLVDLCCKYNINIVICPTDFTEGQLEIIKNKTIKNNIGTVFASTLTSGINLVIDFVERLSRVFPDFNFEIIERHPYNKPSPTKTATIIQHAINRKNTPISSIRLDGYVGVHEITATDGYERISVVHESFSRAAFVRGSILAASFIQKRTGIFYMKDIIKAILLEEKF